MSSPHDRPTAEELLESVREWLENDVMRVGDARVAFHARVAANIIDIVRREYAGADDIEKRHRAMLRDVDVESDDELAQRIRNGHFDDSLGKLLMTLLPVVEDKVAVANPRYLA